MKLPALFTLATMAAAQQHEIGLTLGGASSPARGAPPSRIELGAGRALQANYGHRLTERHNWALLGEVHLLAAPLREVSSADRGATRDVASLYLTPGLRLKLRPRSRVSPFGTIGGGWALYEQSLTTIGGRPNPAPRLTHRAAIQFGGGADVLIWRFLALRGEIRNFYSGSPVFNTAARGGQHNIVAGGGIVLRFGE